MQNIIFGFITTLFLVPGVAFAASGSAGSVETLGVNIVNNGRIVQMRASVYSPVVGSWLFFEYGSTPTLGQVTSPRTLPKNKETVSSIQVSPMTPNATYYYRAVIEGTRGILYGETRSFISNNDQSGTGVSQGISSNTNTAGNVQSGNTNVNTTGSGSVIVGGSTQIASTAGAFGGSSGSSQTQNTNGVAQTQVTGAGGFFQRLFDTATRARPLQLSIVMNPEKPKAREIIEYIVTYTNDSAKSVGGGTLSVVLPDSVVHLSDNSGGKTTLSKVAGGQDITLATNPLSAKGSATITIMAIAGSGVANAVPTAIASMSYMNAEGAVQNIATNKPSTNSTKSAPLVATTNSNASSQSAAVASAGNSSGGILPNTFFEWLIFLVVVTGVIVIVRRVLAVYQERKKRILEEAKPAGVHAHA